MKCSQPSRWIQFKVFFLRVKMMLHGQPREWSESLCGAWRGSEAWQEVNNSIFPSTEKARSWGVWCAPKALIIRWLASSNVSTSHSTLVQHCPWATFYSTSYLHHSQTFWSRHDIFAPHTPPSLFLPLANMDINKIFKFLQKNKSDKKQPASKEIHSLDILRMARKQQHPKSRE